MSWGLFAMFWALLVVCWAGFEFWLIWRKPRSLPRFKMTRPEFTPAFRAMAVVTMDRCVAPCGRQQPDFLKIPLGRWPAIQKGMEWSWRVFTARGWLQPIP